MAKAKKDDGDRKLDALLDTLAAGLASGSIRLVSVRANVCGACKAGTLVGDPTPDWMNRVVCDRCGKESSR